MSLKRILIVEDDSDTSLAYHIILKVKRYDTFFAKDPLSCLWQAHKNRPDLIILDIGLAAGDGFRAIEQLKAAAHLAHIPIVVVSGGSVPTLERTLEFGANAYLQKPVEQAKLLSLVAQLAGESCGEMQGIDHAGARRLAEASI
jgi:CheY-like chemotaxis protein